MTIVFFDFVRKVCHGRPNMNRESSMIKCDGYANAGRPATMRSRRHDLLHDLTFSGPAQLSVAPNHRSLSCLGHLRPMVCYRALRDVLKIHRSYLSKQSAISKI